jgi:Fe(3+) dicitrate transport protein
MNLTYSITTLLLTVWSLKTNAQTADSTKSKELQTITVEGKSLHEDISRLSGITGTYIMEGKKSEVLKVSQLNASITDKTGRQIFAKVPGVFVYDMDGTGNQVNISTRDSTHIEVGSLIFVKMAYYQLRYVCLPCKPLQCTYGKRRTY